MEEVISNTQFKNNECYKEYSKDENGPALLEQMNKSFEQLEIQSCLTNNKRENEHLAGKINNIITMLHVVIVKPCSSDIFLCIGTPLFFVCKNEKSKYTLLGYIDDIFGSIADPMYCVTISCNSADVLNINAYVYYFPDHPNTSHMYVEHTIDVTSNRKKYKIRKRNL